MRVHIRERKRAGGRIALYFDYSLHNRRKSVWPKITLMPGKAWQNKEKRRLAEKLRSKLEMELLYGLHGEIPEHNKKVLFAVWAKKYYERFKGPTMRLMQAVTFSFDKFAPNLTLSSITNLQVKSYYEGLKNTHHASTPNQYVRALKRILGAAKAEGIIKDNPVDGLRFTSTSRKSSKQRLFTPEIKLLYSHPCQSPEVKRAFLFSVLTGLRHSDVYRLKWGQIHTDHINFSQKKTGATNQIPLNDSAIKLLGKKKDPGTLVFKIPQIHRTNAIIKAWVKDAGINKHITYHCARHSFVSLLADLDINQKTVSELAGHASTQETERYTHVTDSMKRKAVNKLPKF